MPTTGFGSPLFDCMEEDKSVWLPRLDIDNRFYKKDGPMIYKFYQDYRWLSNYWPTDQPPKSTEHYYQAAKARSDEEGKNWRKLILAVETPNEAKKLGKKVPIRADWEDVKVNVMKLALAKKFLYSYDLYQKLVDTKDAYLVEGTSWHDNFYGICIRKNCEKCKDIRGKNILGLLLMEMREILVNTIKNKSSGKVEEMLLLSTVFDLVEAGDQYDNG